MDLCDTGKATTCLLPELLGIGNQGRTANKPFTMPCDLGVNQEIGCGYVPGVSSVHETDLWQLRSAIGRILNVHNANMLHVYVTVKGDNTHQRQRHTNGQAKVHRLVELQDSFSTTTVPLGITEVKL